MKYFKSISFVLFTLGWICTLTVKGGNWEKIEPSPTNQDLNCVWGTSTDYAFIVGDTGTILSYDGTDWSPMSSGTTLNLLGLDNNIAVGQYPAGGGEPKILKYDGINWASMNYHGAPDIWLTDVWGEYAVGKEGSVLQYYLDAWHKLSIEEIPGWINLFCIWGTGNNNIYVGSWDGYMFHKNPGWSEETCHANSVFRDIWGSSSADVFAVGEYGLIKHYDGNQWSVMDSGTTEDLKGVWGSSEDNVFAVGSAGVILFFDGSNWSMMSSGITDDLESIWGYWQLPKRDVWAVGNSGAILHYDGITPTPLPTAIPTPSPTPELDPPEGWHDFASQNLEGTWLEESEINDNQIPNCTIQVRDTNSGLRVGELGITTETLGLWHFNESSGGSADNAQGNSLFDGSLNNMTDGNWVSGKYNNCLTFNGENQYIEISAKVPSNIQGTFEAWINPTNITTPGHIIYIGYAGDGYGPEQELHLTLRQTKELAFYFGSANANGVGISLGSTQTIPEDSWTHVAATYQNPGWCRLFINGILVDEEELLNSVITTAWQDYTLFGRPISDLRYFKGKIDEVLIANRAKTSDEICADYSSARYKFSQDGGSSWSEWTRASCGGYNGIRSYQPIIACAVPFHQNSLNQNKIQFALMDMVGNEGISGIHNVNISTPSPTPLGYHTPTPTPSPSPTISVTPTPPPSPSPTISATLTPAVVWVPDQYSKIQTAIDYVPNGFIIMVRPGIYEENINFNGSSIRIESESGPDSTTIDGGQNGCVVMFESGETSAALSGFTITNGKGRAMPYFEGGGITCSNSSSPSISKCIIVDNSSLYAGGGIRIADNSNARIHDVIIYNNLANGSSSSGGGIEIDNSSPHLRNVIIVGNSATGDGGGIYCGGGEIQPKIYDSIIYNNTLESSYPLGRQICVYLYGSASITLNNCCYQDTYSNDIWAFDGGRLDINDCLTSEPGFADYQNADFHLSNHSNCIGTGSSEIWYHTDIENNPRPNPPGSQRDIGPYENPLGSPLPITPTPVASSTPTPYFTPSPTVLPIPSPKITPINPTPTPTTAPTVVPIPSVAPTPCISPVPSPISHSPLWIYDYDGDRTSDIAIFREGSGLWAVRGITRVYFGSSTDETVPGDYNGDGTTEIGIFRGTSGLWAIRGTTRAYFGGGSDLPEPGDYDGDGTADIGIFRDTSGLWAIREVTRAYFGGSADSPASGYYDGDSTKDIGIFRGSSGLWAIRNITRVYFGSSSDTIVPGDYDGDGTWETGIFRESSGLWAIRGVTRSYFGSSVDQPIPGNYKGDGIDDIGIYRGTSGLWAISGMSRVYFGGSGDIPVAR